MARLVASPGPAPPTGSSLAPAAAPAAPSPVSAASPCLQLLQHLRAAAQLAQDLQWHPREVANLRELVRHALDNFLTSVRQLIWGAISRLRVREQDRWDAYQAAVLRLMQRIHRFNPDLPPEPLVWTVALQGIYTVLRASRRFPVLLESEWQIAFRADYWDPWLPVCERACLSAEEIAVLFCRFVGQENLSEIAFFNLVLCACLDELQTGGVSSSLSTVLANRPQDAAIVQHIRAVLVLPRSAPLPFDRALALLDTLQAELPAWSRQRLPLVQTALPNYGSEFRRVRALYHAALEKLRGFLDVSWETEDE